MQITHRIVNSGMFHFVGNDIVDLASVGPAKHLESRFIRRVCTDGEQELLRESSQPELLLWSLWASKETAFKLISKIDLPPVFVHKKFECIQYSAGEDTAEALVKFEDHLVEVELVRTKDWLHATGNFKKKKQTQKKEADVARISGAKKWELSDWQSLFTEKELATINNFDSAFVRLRCKEALAKRFGFKMPDLEIIRPAKNHQSLPPFLLVEGERSEIDISLSHHGDWAGWALCPAAR